MPRDGHLRKGNGNGSALVDVLAGPIGVLPADALQARGVLGGVQQPVGEQEVEGVEERHHHPVRVGGPSHAADPNPEAHTEAEPTPAVRAHLQKLCGDNGIGKYPF